MVCRKEYERTTNISKAFERRLLKIGVSIEELLSSMKTEHEDEEAIPGGGFSISYKCPDNADGYSLDLRQDLIYDSSDLAFRKLTSIWDMFSVQRELGFWNDSKDKKKRVEMNLPIGYDGKIFDIQPEYDENHEFANQLDKIKEGIHYTKVLDILVGLYSRSPIAREKEKPNTLAE